MSTLYVDRKNAEIDLEGDTIVVRSEGERLGTTPLAVLERVVVRGGKSIGARLISKLAEKGVGLTVLSGRGKAPAANLHGQARGDAALRIAQYSLSLDGKARDRIARDLVRAKISAQSQFLLECANRERTNSLNKAISAIDRASEGLASTAPCPPRTQLRGIEGAAASAYFSAFATLFDKSLNFTGRNRRPPRDPVNVCLSLGYTILHSDAVQAISSAGLDPMIGIYHDFAAGRDSLACDISEPARVMVDRWVLELFRQGILQEKSFSFPSATTCRLNKSERSDVYRNFEEAAPRMRVLLERSVRALVEELRTSYSDHGLIPRLNDGET